MQRTPKTDSQSIRGINLSGSCVPTMIFGLTLLIAADAVAQGPVVPPHPVTPPPGTLVGVPIPLPEDLGDFVADVNMARVLGKALFWDMQTGGDGRTACATCHFHAGTDARTRNTVGVRTSQFRGANKTLAGGDFPFHRLSDPTDRSSNLLFDTSEVVGGQGVVNRLFRGITPRGSIDGFNGSPDPTFNVGGVNSRRVTGRNTPTMINAVFNDRQFWDGRANRFFNGVNPFGDQDPDAKVWKEQSGSLQQVRILLDNGSLASQAVGPPNNAVEMSWDGRGFPDLAKKLLALRPLALQLVHPNDSVLGPFVPIKPKKARGLTTKSYADLVRLAFRPEWWSSSTLVDGRDTQMEANFSLFWGLAVMMYEATLVSDDSPFDRFVLGDVTALTAQQQEGLGIFLNAGRCILCHKGAAFTGATVIEMRGLPHEPVVPGEPVVLPEGPIEFMEMQIGPSAFYDNAFYNIGVRPTAEDVGVGGNNPFGPNSFARRSQSGEDLSHLTFVIGPVPPGARVAVDGSFKTPTLRNVELTGPYMHNGGMKSLDEVVQFYARGTDFFHENIDNLDPNVDGIPEINGNPAKMAALVAFLKSLTDERVRFQRAPFDHPEVIVPNGHSSFKRPKGLDDGTAIDNNVIIPAVGAQGGPPIKSFEEILNGAPL